MSDKEYVYHDYRIHEGQGACSKCFYPEQNQLFIDKDKKISSLESSLKEAKENLEMVELDLEKIERECGMDDAMLGTIQKIAHCALRKIRGGKEK